MNKSLGTVEERYRLLVETAQDFIYTVNPDFTLTYLNRAAARSILKNPEDLMGEHVAALFPPGSFDVSLRKIKDVLESGNEVRFEEELHFPERAMWANTVLTPMKDPSGRVTGVMGITRDITKLKQAEQALGENEEKHRTLMENAGEAIIIAQDGRLKYANLAACTISGYSKQELCFSPFTEFVHPDDRQIESDRYAKQIKGNEILRTYEFKLITKAGKLKWVDIHSIGMTWEGRPAVLSFLSDITERKLAEEALRTSEAQLSNALKMAHAGHWEYDVATDTFTFNDNFFRIFRTTAAEAGGYQMSSADYARRFCHPEDAALVGKEIRAALMSSDPNFSRLLDHRILYADGEVGTVSVRFFIIKDAQGRTVKTYGVNQDITERKQREEALRQAEENFRRSLDESPLGIRISDPNGETVYANRAILDVYGYDDVEELRSTPIQNRYTPESFAEYLSRKKKRMAGGDYEAEYLINIVTKSGEIRRLQVFRKEVLWNGQKRFQSIYSDITEREKAAEKIQKTLDRLNKAILGIIQVLFVTTEKRDPYTAGHQRRVADLAWAIGREMGLPAARLEGLGLAGAIHDIGKIGVPAEILSKPTRLTADEYSLIQAHCQVGFDILQGIDFSWPIGKMILQHHERMDGSGYPNRLKGEEILLEARILAVADVVEAMASHRPYRPALGIEAALKEIEDDRGALYDPAVVAACLKLFREKGYSLKG